MVGKRAYYVVALLERVVRLGAVLALASRYDVVYLQRTTFPLGVERLLRWINPRIVFDFDDAIQLRDPDDRESGIVAALKERAKARAVPAVLRISRCSIVEHRFLEAFAREHCERVEKIPGPIDTDMFGRRPQPRATDGGKPIVIGWMGTPLTGMYLPIVSDVLKRLATRHDIEVHLVGCGPVSMPGVPLKIFPWVEAEEVGRLKSFDVGIMPMPNTEWTRGKLGLKMLLYMSTTIPAVVSYTPINAEIIVDGVNGFIAEDEQEWETKLEAVLCDAELRARVGANGRETVEKGFSLRTAVPRLIEILRQVAAD